MSNLVTSIWTKIKPRLEYRYVPLLIAAACFGFSGAIVVWLGTSFTRLANVGVRGLAVVIIASIWLLLAGKSPKDFFPKNINLKWFIPFLIAQAFGNIAFVSAVLILLDANAAIFYLYFAQMIVGFVLGRLFNNEKFDKKKIIALALAILGSIIFSYDSIARSLPPLGMLMGVFCGAAEAVKNLCLGQGRMGDLDKRVIVFWQYLSSFVVSSLAIILFGQVFLAKPLTGLAIVGLCIAALAAFVITWGTKVGFENVDNASGNIILTSEFVFAAIANAILLGQIITGLQIIGILLLIVAVLVVNDVQEKIKPFFHRR